METSLQTAHWCTWGGLALMSHVEACLEERRTLRKVFEEYDFVRQAKKLELIAPLV